MTVKRSAAELVEGVNELSSLPAVYQRIRTLLDDPDSSVMELAKVISIDAALTARLLRVVNSVYFGLMSHVDTVSRAVSLLGMQQVHDVVLATTVASMFKGMRPGNMNMNRFWSNSVMCALAARVAAEMGRAGELERYFVAGLLADLGHLVMYRVEPTLAEQAHLQAERDGRPVHEVEREILGCDYAQVGAALMEKWALPDRLAASIAGQISPASVDAAYRPDAAYVHLGRILVGGMERQLDNDALAAQVDPSVWSITDLKPANVATVRMIAEMGHGEVVALYFPQVQG